MTIDIDPVARLRALAVKVQAMRDKQREFFSRDRRTPTTLRESKALEAQVDHLVDEILDDKPRLF